MGMVVKMRSNGLRAVGYDKDDGRIVRRTVYEDRHGNCYVRMGRYSQHEPDACVSLDWFCEHVLMDGMVLVA